MVLTGCTDLKALLALLVLLGLLGQLETLVFWGFSDQLVNVE